MLKFAVFLANDSRLVPHEIGAAVGHLHICAALVVKCDSLHPRPLVPTYQVTTDWCQTTQNCFMLSLARPVTRQLAANAHMTRHWTSHNVTSPGCQRGRASLFPRLSLASKRTSSASHDFANFFGAVSRIQTQVLPALIRHTSQNVFGRLTNASGSARRSFHHGDAKHVWFKIGGGQVAYADGWNC